MTETEATVATIDEVLADGDEVQGELVETSESVDEASAESTDTQDAEVVAETTPRRGRGRPRRTEAQDAPAAAAVEEKSSFTPAKAKAHTEKITKAVSNAGELFIEAYNGRIWLAYGYESWAQYLDTELGELRPRLPKPERLELVGRMKTEAKMSQGAIATALGVDQKTVSNDLRELRQAGQDVPDTSVATDGRELPASRDNSNRRKPLVEKVSSVFDKLDKAFGDLTELAAEDEWDDELGKIANRHRSDVQRMLTQLNALKTAFASAPEFDEAEAESDA